MARGGTSSLTPPSEADKMAALSDFWSFVDLIGFHGGRQAFGKCHRELVEWYLAEERSLTTLILMPRGHLKSTLITVGMVLWRIYQIPDIRIFVGTATRPLAIAFVREIRTFLEDPWLIEYVWNARPHISGRLVPEMDRTKYARGMETEAKDRKIIWSTTAIQVVRPGIFKEPTVTVGSVGTIPTGFHFDEAYLDDVVTYDNISTPDKRARLQSWIDDLICVIDPQYRDRDWKYILPKEAERFSLLGGKITAVGTRYDRDDWYGMLVEMEVWDTYQRNIYKNGHNAVDGYLWDEVWDETVEKHKRTQMTAARFASQYLNLILAPGSVILDPGQVMWISPGLIQPENDVYKVTHSNLETGWSLVRPIMVVDPAATIGEQSDYTAIGVGGKDCHGNLFLLDARLGKWLSEEILKNMFQMADKWKLRAVHIESVGGFAHFVQFVRSSFNRYRPMVLMEYKPVWTQGKKEVRIANALEPLIKNQMLYMNQQLSDNHEMTDQMLFFPRKTVHDDFPDMLASMAELSKSPQPKPVNNLNEHKNKVYGGYR